jgi:hypothetical protein
MREQQSPVSGDRRQEHPFAIFDDGLTVRRHRCYPLSYPGPRSSVPWPRARVTRTLAAAAGKNSATCVEDNSRSCGPSSCALLSCRNGVELPNECETGLQSNAN